MSSAWPLVLLATNVQFDRSLIAIPGEHGVVGLLQRHCGKGVRRRRAILDIELRDGVAGIGIGEVREQSAQSARRHAPEPRSRCEPSVCWEHGWPPLPFHGTGGSQAMIVDDLEADVVGLAAGAAGDKRPVRQVADRDPGEHGVVGLLHAIVEKVSAARRAILDIELRDGVAGIGIGESS